MEQRNKILSYCLLILYLLTITDTNVLQSKISFLNAPVETSHHHDDFKTVHHEHHFHVGIFHFLGHLLEAVTHSNNFADNHLVITAKNQGKKVSDQNSKVNSFLYIQNYIVFNVDAESLPDPPPYNLLLIPRYSQPNSPLRAPPRLV